MNTAHPAGSENGEYSPRRQGAGLVDIEAMLADVDAESLLALIEGEPLELMLTPEVMETVINNLDPSVLASLLTND